jgi:hypothetical protein
MLRENGTRRLVEKIDSAIGEAEDLGLDFIASILMMARLEADQNKVLVIAGGRNEEHP